MGNGVPGCLRMRKVVFRRADRGSLGPGVGPAVCSSRVGWVSDIDITDDRRDMWAWN